MALTKSQQKTQSGVYIPALKERGFDTEEVDNPDHDDEWIEEQS